MFEQAPTATERSEASDGSGPFDGYSPNEERLLAPHAMLASGFVAAFVGSLVAVERSGRPLPEGLRWGDIVLTGIASHKFSRLITKDKVTDFVRAPFVRYQKPTGQGEVSEEPRGHGMQRALGELLNCPYCLGQWVAGAFMVGLVAAPRPTRLVASMYVAETIADFLQLGYFAAEERA